MATAFYLQTGSLHPLISWLSIPIGCTIFNVILLNEFPDSPIIEGTDGREIGGKIYLNLRRGAYRDEYKLKRLCGLNLAINLGTTAINDPLRHLLPAKDL